jgi:hypothetical protein
MKFIHDMEGWTGRMDNNGVTTYYKNFTNVSKEKHEGFILALEYIESLNKLENTIDKDKK